MASNSFGNLFRITTFGESHGPALGVVVDGCPSGIELKQSDFVHELGRRKPGQSKITTERKEEDLPEILSGIFEGKTTGMPIAIIIRNEDTKPKDYEMLHDTFRPGHADETYYEKYWHRDYRGGGRSSGRETVSRVIAGVIARKVLPESLNIIGHAVQIGPHKAVEFDKEQIESNPVRCADTSVAKEMENYILELKKEGNSSGGLIEIKISNVPKGLGDPVFNKLKSKFADAIMSIGAVTGFSYGAGFEVAEMKGVDYISDRNNFGGILGGITTGEDIVLTLSVKPPTSLGDVAKQGRHDPCIVPRVIPVVEAMVAIVLADAYLMNKSISSN